MTTSSTQQSYPKPVVDYADANANLLDPNKVPASGTTIRCIYTPITPGQRVDVFWEGLVEYYSFQEVPVGGASEITFSITKALVTANLNTTVYVYYTVDGIPSATQPLTIQASGIGDLPPPKVVEAPTDVLDPMNALNGATVRVTYPGMATSDIIGLSWAGDTSLAPQQNGSASGTVDFKIPVSAVAAALGKTVEVIYAVVRGTEIEPSGILYLTVLPISQAQLPTPKIVQAVGQVVDLSVFAGDATAFVPTWPLISVGQTFWLSATGTLANGSLWTWSAQPPGYPINATDVANGVGRSIPRAELEKLKDGSNLIVTCKVGFDGGASESAATVFPLATYVIKTRALISGSETWENVNPQPLQYNVPVRFASGLTVTSGVPAVVGAASEIIVNTGGVGYGTHSYWGGFRYQGGFIVDRFDLGGAVQRVSFIYWASSHPSNKVIFYDEAHSEIETQVLSVGQGPNTVNFSTALYCTHFELWLDHSITLPGTRPVIDNISWG
jgi:hypothetical protein